MEQYERTRLLLGAAAMKKLRASRVAVFGVGGVGGYAVEALARSGVGALDLVDSDTVCLSNLNRQIIATHSTLGRYKVDAAAERVAEIDPDCVVRTYRTFYLPETAGEFDFTRYDYVIDAVDTVTAKLSLAQRAQEAGTPIISAMGAGNKLDPTAFTVSDVYDTSVDPLARVMRRELRRRGVTRLKVVWSTEPPIVPRSDGGAAAQAEPAARRSVPGSTAFVPSVAGLILAGEVIKDLIRDCDREEG